MGQRPKGKVAMTNTERQRKFRRRIAREKKLANPKLVAKQVRRAERELTLAGKILALPDKKYGVISRIPSGRFDVWSRETGLDRAARQSLFDHRRSEVIKSAAMLQSIAADDCVLFLWSTIHHQPPSRYEVINAWGFEYRSQIIWNKRSIGTGLLVSGMNTRSCLIGTTR